ncbi:MAG: hypothetical protein IJE62_01030 [Clostridia bacterium]|nr:hypothetical protein [Clostridia bacterium]
MKKISRIKKAKIAEKLKTIILVVLSLSCLFFCYRSFEIYREQALSDNFWGGTSTANDTTDYGKMTAETQTDVFDRLNEPTFALINQNQGRTVLSGASDDFETVAAVANEMICAAYALPREEITESGKKEWETALKTNSVYLRYSAERYPEYEAEIYKIKNMGFPKFFTEYSEVLVVPSSDKDTAILFRSSGSGKIVKAKIVDDKAKKLLQILEKNDKKNTKDYVFAAELNLDEEANGKAVLNSMILINTNKIKAKDIVAEVPRLYKAGLNFTKTTEFVTDLINIFGYNPNTIRQYVNQEKALIFVGENGNLNIYPDGKLEYKALGINEGIPLLATGSDGISAITFGVCDVIEKVMKVSGVDKDGSGFDIKFAKQPQQALVNKKTEFFFDYFVDGKKVLFEQEPAIYMAVEGGRLVELKMQVKNIKVLETETQIEALIEEIDKDFAENPGKKNIEETGIVYRYNKNGDKIHAEWKLSGER